MRILHVTECDGGGVIRAIDEIVSSTPEHDHLLLSRGSALQRDNGSAFERSWTLPDGHIGRVRSLRQVLIESRADVIHAHSSWAGFYARVMRTEAPVIYQPHSYAFEAPDGVKSLAFFIAEMLLARRATAVAVLSPRESELAKRLHKSSTRIFVPNVPTIMTADPAARPRDRSVVMVGRLSRQKDPSYFGSLCRQVQKMDPSIAFKWIGDGELRSRRRLERAGVEVTGWLADQELRDALSAAGLYVHSARYEGFPLSVLDAAACGAPVLARAIPAFNGTPITQVGSKAKLVRMILQFFADPTGAEVHTDSFPLLDSMNRMAQAEALTRLYAVAGKRRKQQST